MPTLFDREAEKFRKIFIGGLSYDTTEDGLREYFEPFGNITDCVVMKDSNTSKSRGFGFITFDSADAVDKVQDKRPHTIDNRKVETKRAVPRDNQNPDARVTVTKMFIGGIKDDIEGEDVKSYFAQFGEVSDVEMKKDRQTGKKRGFCFVTCTDYDTVDQAVLVGKHMIKGHDLEAKKALPQEEMMGGGYGGHGGGRGRGGGGGGYYGASPMYTAGMYGAPGMYMYDDYGGDYGYYNYYGGGGRGYGGAGGGRGGVARGAGDAYGSYGGGYGGGGRGGGRY